MAREIDAWQRRDVPIGGVTFREFLENPQRRLRKFIERWIVEDGGEKIRSLLDVGCNAGIEAYRLQAAGYRDSYTGMDLNGKAVAVARKLLSTGERNFFLRGDVLRMPFRDRQFDCVLVKDLLEHLPHYREPLAEIARVARTWMAIGIFLPLSRSDRITRHRSGYHLNRYARGPFLEYLGKLGFEVVHFKNIYRLWAREQVLIGKRLAAPPLPLP